jgi:hypothetical protein
VIKVFTTQQSDTAKSTGCEELYNICVKSIFFFLPEIQAQCMSINMYPQVTSICTNKLHQYVPTSYINMYQQVTAKNGCRLRFISPGYCDWIYHKGQNTLLSEVSRLLRCLQQLETVGENTNHPMSNKDEC